MHEQPAPQLRLEWRAGGSHRVHLQFELFTEAGAISAERASAAGADRETVAAILRRAVEQAAKVSGEN